MWGLSNEKRLPRLGRVDAGQSRRENRYYSAGPLVKSCMMRRTGVWLAAFGILTVTASYVSSDRRLNLVHDVGRALDRLKSIPRPFSLGPGVRVEPRSVDATVAVNDSSLSNNTRRRRDVTVVDTANNLFTDHDLVWEVAPGLDMRIFSVKDGFNVQARPSNSAGSGRTFGIMRRMKLALLPIMYKLGVITTLLTLLTVFALKGLTLGVVLLVMGSVGLASKFKHYEPAAWSPPGNKEVHVHVHGGSHSPHAPYHAGYSDPWSRQSMSPDFNDGPILHKGPWNRVGESLWRDPPPSSSTESPWDQFIS